jgi:predicted phosphodiesterase
MDWTRFAVLADVHGNSWALKAVLRDLESRGLAAAVNLGDCLYGPLDPAGTAELLRRLDVPTVRGNQDRIMVDPPPEMARTATWRNIEASLAAKDRRWAAELPPVLELEGGILLCHGTPRRDDETLAELPTPRGVVLRSPADLAALIGETEARLVLCAHSHVPRTVALDDGRLVVNPGSVGLPAYGHDQPVPHVMETGSPHARYCVIEMQPAGIRVDHVAVPYDWSPAVRRAEELERPDWARWLETGRASL